MGKLGGGRRSGVGDLVGGRWHRVGGSVELRREVVRSGRDRGVGAGGGKKCVRHEERGAEGLIGLLVIFSSILPSLLFPHVEQPKKEILVHAPSGPKHLLRGTVWHRRVKVWVYFSEGDL